MGVKILLFNFSLGLKWFHPDFDVLSLFHHIKELFTCIFIRKLSYMKLNILKPRNKSRRLSLLHLKIVLIHIWKLLIHQCFVKEYFDSWVCKHATLLTLFLNIMMWNIDSKLAFLIYNSMCGDDCCTIINFQICTFVKKCDVHGPIINLFIWIEKGFTIFLNLTLVSTICKFV